MKFKLQTIRLGMAAAATMLGFAAMAQTPGNSSPAEVKATPPPDMVAAYEKARDAAHRDDLLKAAKAINAAPPAATPVEREATASASAQNLQSGNVAREGVQIHGHWVIDVRNPDGTLAGHHDFQNSLLGGGPFSLGGLLYGELVPAGWMITFSGTSPVCANSTSSLCGIAQSLTTSPGGMECTAGSITCVAGLTTAFNYNATPISLSLTGSLTATQTGNINAVGTYLGFCVSAGAATYTPQSCAQAVPNGNTVTATAFSGTSITAIPVSSGQIVQVTVTFTFS